MKDAWDAESSEEEEESEETSGRFLLHSFIRLINFLVEFLTIFLIAFYQFFF